MKTYQTERAAKNCKNEKTFLANTKHDKRQYKCTIKGKPLIEKLKTAFIKVKTCFRHFNFLFMSK